MDKLKQQGAEVSYYDPHVPKIKLTRRHSRLAGARSVEWTRENISSFDIVVISTAHDSVDIQELAYWAPLIIDTRNAMQGINTKPGQVWTA